MAIPEACGVWIEQRVQEELENREESKNSLREIGRKVAAEVEKYFETKVNPGTLAAKASRMNRVSNDTPTETPEIIDASSGGGGGLFPAETVTEIPIPPADPSVESPKTTAELVTEVTVAVDKGTSIREATRKIAEEHEKKPTTLRRAYQKKMAPSEPKQEPLIEDIVSGPQPEEETPVTEKPQVEKKSEQRKCTEAMQFATIAISQLERISKEDPNKQKAFDKVNTWMEQNR